MRGPVFLISLMLLAVAMANKAARQPKLFFVTSSTSTSISTTTSMLQTSFTCYMISKTDFGSVCPGRRKKRGLVIDDAVTDFYPSITASRVARSIDEIDDITSSKSQLEAGRREAKFNWYYMTTTVLSISTSTSTSTSFTATISVSLLNCTPTDFTACG